MASEEAINPLINITPSIVLICFLVLIHAAAIVAAYFAKLPVFIATAIIISVIYSLIYSLRRYGTMTSNNSITAFGYNAHGNWQLQTKTGQQIAVSLKGNSYISRFLIILNFNCEQKLFAIPVIILSSVIDREQFKKLRVFLLFTRGNYA